MPETLPDDPILLKQLLLSASVQMSEKDGQIERLREQNALLIQRLFGRKSEQSSDPDSPQLEIFNEAESLAEAAPEAPEAPVDAVEKGLHDPGSGQGFRPNACRQIDRALLCQIHLCFPITGIEKAGGIAPRPNHSGYAQA